jgi:hypothetical protein
MLQITLHLTRSSRLWPLLLLGLEVLLLRSEKKLHFNRLYGDTQSRDYRPLEVKGILFISVQLSRLYCLPFDVFQSFLFQDNSNYFSSTYN